MGMGMGCQNVSRVMSLRRREEEPLCAVFSLSCLLLWELGIWEEREEGTVVEEDRSSQKTTRDLFNSHERADFHTHLVIFSHARTLPFGFRDRDTDHRSS
jgi:hypothetical protein